MKTAITKWGLSLLMFVWFGLSMVFLAGEDDPEHPISLLAFFIMKGAALGSFYLWWRVFKYLSDRDLLPTALFPDLDEEEEDW